ncbi:lamin tail domain-containing protein [Candidatus Saccharibacteria bacterium]|nr:lamin tail domain-containing protein [Candidatus Saccharibacteria bacterium]
MNVLHKVLNRTMISLLVALPMLGILINGAPPVRAVAKPVVISELQPGSPTSSGDEFVELYNNTNSDIDISGWSLYYKSATGTSWSKKATLPSGSVIAAHGFWLLASDIAANTKFNSGLAQTGGNIQLRDSNDSAVDQFAWGNGDSPLGLAAPAPVTNEVLARDFDDATQTMLNSDNNLSDFSLSTTATPGAIPAVEPPNPGDQGVDDPSPANYARIVVTELLPDPASPQVDSSDEFIELYNPTGADVDLNGWSLRDGSGKVFVIKSKTIAAGGYLVLYSKETSITLNNTGDVISLLAPDGSIGDTTPDYGNAKQGLSWGLVNGEWTWTTSPTPGGVNSAALVDSAGSTTAKAAASKKTTAKKVAAAKTSKAKAAAKSPVAKIANSATEAAANISKNSTLWTWLLIVLGVGTIGYGIYEYRPEIINTYHKLRTKFGLGVKTSSKP